MLITYMLTPISGMNAAKDRCISSTPAFDPFPTGADTQHKKCLHNS